MQWPKQRQRMPTCNTLCCLILIHFYINAAICGITYGNVQYDNADAVNNAADADDDDDDGKGRLTHGINTKWRTNANVTDMNMFQLNAKQQRQQSTSTTTTTTETKEDLYDLLSDNWSMEHIIKDMKIAALLRQQLIYKFAIEHKQISRVTYFTCRKPSMHQPTNEQTAGQGKADGHTMGDTLVRQYYDDVYQHMHGFKLLQRLHEEVNGNVAMPYNEAATSAATTTANATAAADADADNSGNVTGYALKGYATNATTMANISKTTTTPTTTASTTANNANTARYGGILIKTLQIDQLINKKPTNRAGKTQGGGWYGRGSSNNAGSGSGNTKGNTFSSVVWLEEALRPDLFHQIVVLDMACGAASRRLLELASNKMYFSAVYHWLLIEDYALERWQERNVDDNNHNGNVVNNTNNTNNNNNESNINNAELSENQSAKQNEQQQMKMGKTMTNNVGGTYGNANGNANDTEPIEQFLAKLNFYVNTELILAQRVRADMPMPAADDGIPPLAAAADDDDDASHINEQSNGASTAFASTNYYKLYDIWNTGYQFAGQLNISYIGNFTYAHGFQLAAWYRHTTTISRRMNLQLARVRCLIVVTNKNVSGSLEHYITTPYDTHLDSMNRFNYALLVAVRDMFNMSYILSKTSTWGYLKNGKFDGMIGALVRQQADIGGSPIFFRLERAKVIDYTSRTWTSRPCFIFRHPRSTKKDRIVFLQPFSNAVWVLLAICGCATVLLLWLLTSMERVLLPDDNFQLFSGKGAAAAFTMQQQQRQLKEATCTSAVTRPTTTATVAKGSISAKLGSGGMRGGRAGERNFRLRKLHWRNLFFRRVSGDVTKQRRVGLFLESVLFYIGLICQQGLSFSTNLIAGRCIVIISLLFAFAIYQFYSASIVGTLLMEKPKTIRKLADLTHSFLEIGIEDIVYNRDYFLRTKDPDAIELYAKKVTSVPIKADEDYLETPPDAVLNAIATAAPTMPATVASKAKSYREILHSHETGAHAKTNEASNWYDPDYGIAKVKKGKFAFHVDVATAYKIIADTFIEREICDLTEIQLFPPQKCMGIVQKGSPLRKIITYGLRRTAEVGVMDYQFKIWHSPKPRCSKQIHTDDLQVDLETFASALLLLAFGYLVSLLTLGLEILHQRMWQRALKGI